MKSIFSLFIIMALVSFLGFIVENLWMAFTKGYIDNRNMVFPFLIGYGLAIALIYLAFGTPRNLTIFGNDINIPSIHLEILLYFIIVMVCVSLGEIFLGKSVEKICHIKWWDYSKLPMHITQYTSVFTSIGFTMMIVLFMDKVFVPLHSWLMTCDIQVLKFTSITVMTIMTADFFHSAYIMYKRKSFFKIWQINVCRSAINKKICVVNENKNQNI